jgi:hypothetical protein
MIALMTNQVEREATQTQARLLARIAEGREKMKRELAERLPRWLTTRDAEQLMAMEREEQQMCREEADMVVEAVLSSIVQDKQFQRQAARAVDGGEQPYLSCGRRAVKVTLLGGTTLRVQVPYMRPDIRSRPGRKRSHGRRGKGGVGLYPVLAALGIGFRGTAGTSDLYRGSMNVAAPAVQRKSWSPRG